ncbi:MAG TPA: succinate dehydrogenase [Candidatus Limnocylindria bacterium]|nr:succinate dehydrogenase [Candidatus Limnocylindria bacterium]
MTVQSAVLRALRKPRGSAPQGFGETKRRDAWAIYPLLQATVFTICAGYLTFSGVLWGPLFGPQYVAWDGYLSPLFSPLLVFPNMPTWLSPGLLILWIPIGFRATCYYYRKAYYRFYFADPPGCAVGEPTVHRRFALENAFPFILQNLHRYMLYLAFIPLTFLWLDILPAFNAPDPATGAELTRGVVDPGPRIGLGGVLFLLNVILLTGYSLSCHSLRHLVGGRVDCFSCTRARRVRYTLWQRLTDLNRNHMWWAWSSLVTVTLTDVYVRLLQAGVITDPAIRLG